MQRWACFAGVLAAALAWPGSVAAQGLSQEIGVDRPGGDLRSFQTDRLDDCQDACRRDRDCRAYTYLPQKDACYLKSRVTSARRLEGAVSGVKRGSSGEEGGGLSREPGFDHYGNDYTSFRVDDVDDCRSACARDRRCEAYTFRLRSRTCFLKDEPGRIVACNDCVTGTRRGGGGQRGDLTEERGLDRKGNDYTSYRARTLGQCQRDCREDNRCRAYTYMLSSGDCYLKDRINKPQRNGGAVTGHKE